MSLAPHHALGAAAVGVGASLLMDAWNLFLKRAVGVPSLDYGLLGRWILHMPAGRFLHASIRAAPPRRFERAVGWLAHYTIGAGFALVFVALGSGDWLARPTLLPALLYGMATVAVPFFVMQPALGLGIASSRTPRPAQARLKSLATHAVFGAGMYLCALVVSPLLPATHAAIQR